jgi:hypothetical protein
MIVLPTSQTQPQRNTLQPRSDSPQGTIVAKLDHSRARRTTTIPTSREAEPTATTPARTLDTIVIDSMARATAISTTSAPEPSTSCTNTPGATTTLTGRDPDTVTTTTTHIGLNKVVDAKVNADEAEDAPPPTDSEERGQGPLPPSHRTTCSQSTKSSTTPRAPDATTCARTTTAPSIR